jgi:hypothetical protein
MNPTYGTSHFLGDESHKLINPQELISGSIFSISRTKRTISRGSNSMFGVYLIIICTIEKSLIAL